MKCDRNHTDPNDNPSDMHIAACYEAYEIYWDRDGLVDEREFNEQSVENRLAEIKQFGSRPASDPIRKAVLPGYENDPDTTCLCGAPSHNDVCSVDGCVASQSHSSDTDCMGDDNCCTVSTPIIHMNGTPKERLLEQWEEAYSAVKTAYNKLARAGPNERDYYLEPGRFDNALSEHFERMKKIRSVLDDLRELSKAIFFEPDN